MKEDHSKRQASRASVKEADTYQTQEPAALIPAGTSESDSKELTVNERVTGLLKVCELLAARTKDLDALEWKISYAIWTIIALCIAATLNGKPIPKAWVWAFAAVALHVFAFDLLYDSQWRNVEHWKTCMVPIRKALGLSALEETEESWDQGRDARWFRWLILRAGVSLILALILLTIN